MEEQIETQIIEPEKESEDFTTDVVKNEKGINNPTFEDSGESENSNVSDQAKNSNTQIGKLENTNVDSTGDNKMREIEIEKIILHSGGTEDKLEKSVKLLEKIAKNVGIENKVYVVQSTRRIPAFGISPGKKSGCKITIRNKQKIIDLLKRFFSSLDNTIKKKQVTENQVCFGIHEYIEVPGLEYDRDIGILGFEVMVVFKRKGKSVGIRKIKRGKVPRRQNVTKQEIVDFLIKHFELEVEGK